MGYIRINLLLLLLRVNALVEKTNAFSNHFFSNAFGLYYSLLTPWRCAVGMSSL